MSKTKFQWSKKGLDIRVGFFGGTHSSNPGIKWTTEHNVGRKTDKQTTHDTLKDALKEARRVRKGRGWRGYGFLG